MRITVRDAVPADADVLADFNSRLATESEGLGLPPETVLRGVRRVLADPHRGFYLVAEIDGAVAGQVMVTAEWSDWRDGWMWWAQSVYTRPETRRQGVLRALLAEVRRRAAAAGDVVGLRLYVEPHNAAALAAYRALGFGSPTYLVIESDIGG